MRVIKNHKRILSNLTKSRVLLLFTLYLVNGLVFVNEGTTNSAIVRDIQNSSEFHFSEDFSNHHYFSDSFFEEVEISEVQEENNKKEENKCSYQSSTDFKNDLVTKNLLTSFSLLSFLNQQKTKLYILFHCWKNLLT